jgi:hypothetical protein
MIGDFLLWELFVVLPAIPLLANLWLFFAPARS